MILLAKDEQQRNQPKISVKYRKSKPSLLKNITAYQQTFETKAKMLFVHFHPDVQGPANTLEAWKCFYGECYRTMNHWWTEPNKIRGWLCFLEQLTWQDLRSDQKELKKMAPIF